MTSNTISAAKPLFWRKPSDHPQDHPGAQWIAAGLGGHYAIDCGRDGAITLWWAHDMFDHVDCATVAEAKARAEADWQRRYAERAAR